MVRTGVWGDKYRICMTSKNGRKLYLEVTNIFYHKDGTYTRQYGWTWNKQTSMVFDKKEDAELLASEHFKKFNGWYIDTQNEYLGVI